MEWTISPLLPLWITVLLAAGGLVASFLQYRPVRRRIGRKKAVTLSLTRLGALWLAILFTLNPSLTGETKYRVTPTVAVLVDTSLSMGLPGQTGKGSRLDEAKELLTGGPPAQMLLSSLARNHDVRLYALGGQLRRITPGDLPGLKADGKRGSLEEALKELSGEASCVVLVSDGTFIGQGVTPSPPGGPSVIAVPMGDRREYKDVMITSVRFPQVVFRGRETSIEAVIRSHGYNDVTVPAVLKDGNRLLTARNVRLGSAAPEATVSFPFVATEAGTRHLSIAVQPQVGESITENNGADLSLKVARDKIRMLMVSGSPSLNYRFMRFALKSDPSVDLLSFVILRAPSNVINVPLKEQSLIPFPVDTLFTKELKDFDLVMFDNLPLRTYLNRKHLEAVREFVRGGGALAMIGGPKLSDDKGLASSALADILPVACEETDYRRGVNASLRLTAAGAAHPLTRLSDDREDNGRLWKAMTPLDGINLLRPMGPATVLLETGGVPAHPVLAVGGYGKGRVLVLGTDYAWKWDAGMVAKGMDNSAYLRFVGRAVRWLTKDPSFDRMTLTLPEKPGEAGEDVHVKIRTDEEQPGRTEPPVFSVFGPDGARITSEVKPGAPAGEFIGFFTPPQRGAYRLTVKSSAGAIEEVVMIGTAMDRLDGVPNHEVLKQAAANTGGKVLSGGKGLLDEIATYAQKEQRSFTEKKEIPLWSNYYCLAAIIALLSTEWYLRRRWGLA